MHTGHNDAQLRCFYFAGGDITSAPTASYTVGTLNSRWSYPQAKVISGTTIGVLCRGTLGDGTATDDPDEHASVFWEFNGTNGSSASATVIYDTDDGARDGKRAYSIGWDIQSDGTDTLIGFLHNFRDWSDDRPESILAVIWDYTNDTWHLLNGDEIGVATTGTAQGDGTTDSPIVPTAIIGQKLTASAGSRGPLLITDSDLSVNTLHVPDADAFAFDLTGGLSDAKLFTLYTAADQAAGGGYVDAPWYTLTYDGTTLRPSESATIRGGTAKGTFNSAACSWKDGTVGGTLRIGILNRTQVTLTGFGTEVSSPYYEGWGGGDAYTVYETATPFVSEPIASATIVAQADTASDKMLSQIGIVDGLPNSFNAYQGVQRGHATKQHKHVHLIDDAMVSRLIDGTSTLTVSPPGGGFRTRNFRGRGGGVR